MASISIPGAGSTEKFALQKGGKQGGPDTPDEFGIMMEAIVEPLAQSWSSRGFGFCLDNTAATVSHIIWADNIFVLV